MWYSPVNGARAGGDWCDCVELGDDVVALTVGDVSGHGEAVADSMQAVRAKVLRALRLTRIPSEVLRVANAAAASYGDGIIVTALVAFFDRRTGTLVFANAGHPPPLLVSRDRAEFLTRPPADLPLGIFADHDSRDHTFAMPEDALLSFYTDGVTEHERDVLGGELELARAARLAYLLPALDPARRIAEQIFRNGRGTADDAAILVVRRLSRNVALFQVSPLYGAVRGPSTAGFGSALEAAPEALS